MGLNILVTTTTDTTFSGRLLYTWLMWFLYSVGTMINPSDKSSPMSDVKVSFAIGCMTSDRNASINLLNGLFSCTYLYDVPGFESDGMIHKKKFAVSYPDVRRLLFLHALSQVGDYDAIIYADLDAFFVRNPLPELIKVQKDGASVAFSRAGYTTNLPCNGFLTLYDRTLTSEYLKYGYYSQNQIGETWFKSALELLQKDEKNKGSQERLFHYINNTYENATHHIPIATFTIPKLKSDTASILKQMKASPTPNIIIASSANNRVQLKPLAAPPQRYFPTQLNKREYISQSKEVWKIRFLDGWNYFRGLCADIPSYATIVHCQSSYFDSSKKSSDLEKFSLLLPFTDGQIRVFDLLPPPPLPLPGTDLEAKPKPGFVSMPFRPRAVPQPTTTHRIMNTLKNNFTDVFIPDVNDRLVKITEFYMRDTNTLAMDDAMKYEIKINTFQFRPDLNGKQLKTVIESLPGWKRVSGRYNITSSVQG
jgi:hypothetical protein